MLGWRLCKEEAAVLQRGKETRCRGEASDAIADPTGCDDAVLGAWQRKERAEYGRESQERRSQKED